MAIERKNTCPIAGVKGRRIDCNNYSLTNPTNHRPNVCRECIKNPEAQKIADLPLPLVWVAEKQQKDS